MTAESGAGGYHLRRSDRAVTDPAEVDELLAGGRFVTIAFARGDEPYLVTLSYGFDPEARRLYFHAAKEGLKYEFIEANPLVCATVVVDRGYHHGNCEHEYASVVMRGTMSVVRDREESRWGMEVLLGQLETPTDAEALALKHHLDADAVYGRMAVLRMDIGEVTAKAGR